MKKRVLVCGESSHLGSGFGKYTKNLMQRLYDSEKYDIAELSCYRTTSTPKTEPWTIYPVAVDKNHPSYDEYQKIENNKYGQWRYDLALIYFKPHIVVDFRDFWNFTFQETSPLRNFYHWLIAPTYDSAPPRIDVVNRFKNADTLCFHTQGAMDNLVQEYNYKSDNIGNIVSDAIDHTIFKPIGYSKKFHKIKFGLPDNSFIVGSVMRNQKRKLIPDLLSTFAKFAANHSEKNPILYLHTSYPEIMGWDLPALLLEYNIANRVYITYICKQCEHYFASKYKGMSTHCTKCGKYAASIANVQRHISDQDLCKIYNLFDVYVQYAICEGFGIPPVEAAACGVPIITIDSEAMGEVGKNLNAMMVPVKRIFRELETNANRIYPDNDALYAKLIECSNMDNNTLNNIGKSCRKSCLDNYNWHKTAIAYQEIFDSVDISKKLSWDDTPKRNTNPSYKVPSHTSNRDMIYDIIDNIIYDPFLKKTDFIELLIRCLDDGVITEGAIVKPFSLNEGIKLLEAYMNNKNGLELLRLKDPLVMSAYDNKMKDFIEYNK